MLQRRQLFCQELLIGRIEITRIAVLVNFSSDIFANDKVKINLGKRKHKPGPTLVKCK
jgi:hypothetical protein